MDGRDGTKQAIRRAMRARRRVLSPAAVRRAGDSVAARVARLIPYRDAAAVLAYAATDNEVPTDPLLARAARAGKTIFLPRVEGDDLAFVHYQPGAPLFSGYAGIPEPDGPGVAVDPAVTVVLVPVVACDPSGARLGRGRGAYDRALRRTPDWLAIIALAHDFQLQAAVPRDPWDIPVDYIITDRAVIACRGADDATRTAKEGSVASWNT
jgi:5-formyltetrahydrofolate cyclo-ligase